MVDFSPEEPKKGHKKRFYVGKVTKILKGQVYEGTFLRSTFHGDGSTFSHPITEDLSEFSYVQVLGSLSEPENLRRGVLKFAVKPNLC